MFGDDDIKVVDRKTRRVNERSKEMEKERKKRKPTLAFHHMEECGAMGMLAYAECGVSPAELKFGWRTPVCTLLRIQHAVTSDP